MWATKETPQKSSHSYNTTTLLAKHITSQAVSNSQLQLPNLEASWGFAAAKDAPQRRVTMPEGAQPEVGIEPVGLMMVDAKLIKSDPSDRLVSRCLIFFCIFFWFLGWMPAKFRLKEPALWDGQCDVGCLFLGGGCLVAEWISWIISILWWVDSSCFIILLWFHWREESRLTYEPKVGAVKRVEARQILKPAILRYHMVYYY